ncbi:MAG: MFS transporter [Alicyclobacillaceae bacterium]|jgi:MFS family permease|nr:MFS transporter [Alicyclobacillaceae bacterium]MCY0895019.1 MFS transporter [Alicyclobacillaceae bacterium]
MFQAKWRLLKKRNFSLFFLGQSASQFGLSFNVLALLWLMRTLTGGLLSSTLLMGLVLVADAIPRIILSPFAGVLIDRWKKREVMRIADAARMVLLVVLAALIFAHVVMIWEVLAIALLQSVFSTFFSPSDAVLRTRLVEQDDLLEANSIIQTGKTAMGVAGPAVGGLLIGFAGLGYAFSVGAITYLISFVALTMMQVDEPDLVKRPLEVHSFFQDLRGGFEVFQTVRYAKIFTPFLMLFNFPMAALDLLLVQYVAIHLHYQTSTGATMVGLINASLAVGEVIGGLLVSTVAAKIRRELLFVYCTSIAALMILFTGFTDNIPLICVWFFFGGFFMVMVNVAFFTGIQQAVPGPQLGRTFALLQTAFNGMTPVSQLVFGGLAAVIPIGLLFSLLGAIGFVAGFSPIFHPFVRRGELAEKPAEQVESA